MTYAIINGLLFIGLIYLIYRYCKAKLDPFLILMLIMLTLNTLITFIQEVRECCYN